MEDLDGRIDAVLAIDELHVGLESSVVDCTGPVPRLLRPGAVGLWDLQQLFPETQQLACTGDNQPVNSPGLRYAHYQPRAQVLLFDEHFNWQLLTAENGRLKFAYCGMLPLPQQIASVLTQTYSTVEAYAQGFYEFLRQADRLGADVILVQLVQSSTPSETRQGLAAALRDRQLRAAGQTRAPGQT
jgi:L-threonylcarbamoyladenylate synthase